MEAYVARQAITNNKQQTIGYELLFRDGHSNCFPNIDPDEATSKILTGNYLSNGFEDIASDKTVFINFHSKTLLERFPSFLPKASTVVEIVETVTVTESLINACQHIANKGYKLALDDYDFAPQWEPLLNVISIVKVDISSINIEIFQTDIEKLKKQKIKLIAERVETKEDFETCKKMGFDFFQGYYFAKPEIQKNYRIPASSATMLELLNVANAPEFDLQKLDNIVKRDVSITYKLLRCVNNPTVNKRQEITSLRHALVFLGESEVRKFISLLALANLGGDQPEELTATSLLRGRFCELVVLAGKNGAGETNGFLMGLLSLVDVMLHVQMTTLMAKLPLEQTVKQALCGVDNLLRQYLRLIQAFEAANWQVIRGLCEKLKLKQDSAHLIYIESVKWSSSILRSLQ